MVIIFGNALHVVLNIIDQDQNSFSAKNKWEPIRSFVVALESIESGKGVLDALEYPRPCFRVNKQPNRHYYLLLCR